MTNSRKNSLQSENTTMARCVPNSCFRYYQAQTKKPFSFVSVRSFHATKKTYAIPFLGAIPVIGFVAKQATLWNVYLVLHRYLRIPEGLCRAGKLRLSTNKLSVSFCSSYGWPRVYRNLLRSTKVLPETYTRSATEQRILRER